jgi:cell division protein FtsL
MKRRRRKPSLARKILWFFLLMLAFTSLRTWYIQEQESRHLDQERQQYQAQIDLLDAEIERLRNTLENITDDEHIEAMARKNLKMIKENEWVLIDIQDGKE